MSPDCERIDFSHYDGTGDISVTGYPLVKPQRVEHVSPTGISVKHDKIIHRRHQASPSQKPR